MIPSRRRRRYECYWYRTIQAFVKKWNYQETKELSRHKDAATHGDYPHTGGVLNSRRPEGVVASSIRIGA
jgi:hypothetical protein